MLIVKVGKKENINQALKRFKRKVSKSKMMKEIRERKNFMKPSMKKRIQKLKAINTNKWLKENGELE
jgi:small subunit ribosomal protein S21|tara:strand:- start:458 stop:658 length:201 start_codon:yes stop_codon:yes gene_type:complete